MTTAARCPVKIKAWNEADGTFQCRLDAGHPFKHRATGLYAHQTISWSDGDRRCFVGELTDCDQSTCILPAGHRGGHVT